MRPTLSPQDFVAKWRQVELKERSAAQEHFHDVCRLVGHGTPAEADPAGRDFTFEAGASRGSGGQGFADVWYRGHFAWEYKGKYADLDRAYQQLLQYREALENPPLLIVSDMERIVIHTNFTNTVKRIVRLELDDLRTPAGLDQLRDAFYNPAAFRTPKTTTQATEEAAAQFARIAELRRRYGDDPRTVAHFLIRLLFCLFAEDTRLLPNEVFSRLITQTYRNPAGFTRNLQLLFAAMAGGGDFLLEEIRRFDGRLFDNADVLTLDSESLELLARVCTLDWASIEPAVFGTLFERSLDPAKRSQLGAHYTSREDILLIVEPVLMAPLRRRWAQVQEQAQELARKRDQAQGAPRTKLAKQLTALLTGFVAEIAGVQILDPACGSGNFLYVALKQLLDLEKEVGTFAAGLGLSRMLPTVSPTQFHGLELNEYACELAQATIWIGYLQWFSENGYGIPPEPILKPLDNIRQMDAILAYDEQGQPVEPVWPAADVIIGNPPFLGDKKMRAELGDKYVNDLRALFSNRIPGQSDLVCYWFEKARAAIVAGECQRAGLLATQNIRGGASREVLKRITETGRIFFAISDREWVLDGAMVHISMAGFDGGGETVRVLDGRPVPAIHANLTSISDITQAFRLPENSGRGFIGSCKGGSFDIAEEEALALLHEGGNPHGRPNSDVIRPVMNSRDLLGTSNPRWIIDNADLSLEEAAMYVAPHAIVKARVKPDRDRNRDAWLRTNWWRPQRMRPEMRQAVAPLSRFLVTPTTSKHRIFSWLKAPTLPDHKLVVFARADDYFCGVLLSSVHEAWSRAQGTQLRERESGLNYNVQSCFETFPFPRPTAEQEEQIAMQAAALNHLRQNWLTPSEYMREEVLEFPGSQQGPWSCYLASTDAAGIGVVRYPRQVPKGPEAAEVIRARTLTALYNEYADWLQLAHQKLDEAVLEAYGWPHKLSDEEVLERLLVLNLERVGDKT